MFAYLASYDLRADQSTLGYEGLRPLAPVQSTFTVFLSPKSSSTGKYCRRHRRPNPLWQYRHARVYNPV